jgi:hypothetical protein
MKKQELVFEVSHGSRGPMLRQQRIPLDEALPVGQPVMVTPVIVNDARTDPALATG